MISDFIEGERTKSENPQTDLKLETVYLHDILADEVAQRLFAMAQKITQAV